MFIYISTSIRVIGPLVSPANRRNRKAAEMLRPYFEERLQMEESERPVGKSSRFIIIYFLTIRERRET
jgi:hypothetical protein